MNKITKLEKQLVRWLPRGLSVEGKVLIVKTFGLSQIIYSLQMCEIEVREVKAIESVIFKFLWNKKWVGNQAPDRIKRSTLKMPYEEGGLKVPDISILDKALKTKQFIRAMKSNHYINLIQKYVLEKEGYLEYYKIEYAKICKIDVTASYQITTNILTDGFRVGEVWNGITNDWAKQNRVNIVESTDIIEFFRRKNIPLVLYRFRRLANEGIENLHELINEVMFPRDNQLQRCAQEIINFIPAEWVNLIYNEPEVNPNTVINIHPINGN